MTSLNSFKLNLFIACLEKVEAFIKVSNSFNIVPKISNRTYLNYNYTYPELKKAYNYLAKVLESEKYKLQHNTNNYINNPNYYINMQFLINRFDTIEKLIDQVDNLKNLNVNNNKNNTLVQTNENYSEVNELDDNNNNEIVKSNNKPSFLNGQKRNFHSTTRILRLKSKKVEVSKNLQSFYENIKNILENNESFENKQLKIENL